MKAAIALKYVDLAGQILMLFPLLRLLNAPAANAIGYTYITVGGWQLLSLVLHSVLSTAGRARRRQYAQVVATLGISLVLAVTCIGTEPMFNGDRETVAGTISIAGGFLLAIWYFLISVSDLKNELAATVHRREIHWKL